MNSKEFDRSVCFQFYESYLEQAELVKDQLGAEMCAKYFIALARYGLYQEETDDLMVRMLISGLKNTIDAGQLKRAKAFGGNGQELTNKILKYKEENRDATQREIADACQCSVGKVNKVLNSNTNTNNNYNTTSNSNNNSVNVNVNTRTIQEDTNKKMEDLTEEEAQAIIKKLKQGTKYVDIQKEYGLAFGSVTKNFEKEWNKIKSSRSYMAEQQAEMQRRANEPQIDYTRLGNSASCSREVREHNLMMDEIMSDLLADI